MDTDPRNGMEILSESQCWDLLDEEVVGRLAVAPGGRPDIFPVNFITHDGAILFRTAEGSKLASVAALVGWGRSAATGSTGSRATVTARSWWLSQRSAARAA